MYKNMALKIAKIFEKQNIITFNEIPSYSYGLELLISTTITIVVIISISLFTGYILDTLFFLFGFIIFRVLCGGYHAKHHISCFLTTLVNYLLFMLLIHFCKSASVSEIMISILNFIATLLIFKFAPIENINNPLSNSQIKIKKTKSRTAIIGFCLFSLFCLKFHFGVRYILSMSIGIFSVGLSLVGAKIQSIKRR